MYNYEMDPVSWRYTADTIPSTDGQTDGQGHTSIPPLSTLLKLRV